MFAGMWRRSIGSSRSREKAYFLRRHAMTPLTPRPMRQMQSGNKSSSGDDVKGGTLEFVKVMRELARRARVEAIELSELVKNFALVELPVIVPRVFVFVGLLHVVPEYGFKCVTCEGPSMEPTIIDGSYTCVLVERFSHRIYGLGGDDDASLGDGEPDTTANEDRCRGAVDDDPMKHLIGQYETLMKGVWDQHFRTGLQRGDVIIAHHPLKVSTICKRIVALPGDIIQRTDGGSRETGHRIEVPKGHIWIEGDNSCASLDSREYGCVPASLVIGKVVCRLWPLREYVSLGLDGNGLEHWRYVSARIGRGRRPLDTRTGKEQMNGSFVV